MKKNIKLINSRFKNDFNFPLLTRKITQGF